MSGHWPDRHARAAVARERNRPRWQQLAGNFGFGFPFVGALANLALVTIMAAFEVWPPTLDHPWWPTFFFVCVLAGLAWREHGRSFARRRFFGMGLGPLRRGRDGDAGRR